MNKEAVLPIPIQLWSAEAQRDADWKRILPLLEAVKQVVGCMVPEHGNPLPCSRCIGKLVNAYEQLEAQCVKLGVKE